MSRLVHAFVLGLLCVSASASAVAQSQPPIAGGIDGHEVCPQFIQFCGGRAWFAGKFVGQVVSKGPSSGSFLVGVSHESLNQTEGGMTQVTGGEWVIVIGQERQLISGVVQPGGTLTYHPATNAFDVALTLLLSDGRGTVNFRGMLAHSPFPPQITGMLVL